MGMRKGVGIMEDLAVASCRKFILTKVLLLKMKVRNRRKQSSCLFLILYIGTFFTEAN
jgi:hypothetical protein